MTMSELTTADKVAMYGGTGLVLLGTFGIGFVEMFLGSTHPVSGEGQIEHDALIPIELRSGIIILGLVIWGVYAIYKFIGDPPHAEETAAEV